MRVIDRRVVGVAEMLRRESAKTERNAWLSRAECGTVKERCAIVNMPGHPNAATVCTQLIMPLVPRMINVMMD
jgi:molybdopterin biosynthesis enzyme MoaB